MKQELFDVLLYLFENYIYDDEQFDADTLEDELARAGFHQGSINKAFDWLDGLSTAHEKGKLLTAPSHQGSMRIHTDEESLRLDSECRGFLLFLEQMGVLDHINRETVMDRLMALDSEEIDLEQLKWVVLMVLFNQPGQEEAAVWMEDIVIDEMAILLH
jgi:Smg protein